MRLLHSLAKIHATFDDPNLVSRAGLVPVMAACQPSRVSWRVRSWRSRTSLMSRRVPSCRRLSTTSLDPATYVSRPAAAGWSSTNARGRRWPAQCGRPTRTGRTRLRAHGTARTRRRRCRSAAAGSIPGRRPPENHSLAGHPLACQSDHLRGGVDRGDAAGVSDQVPGPDSGSAGDLQQVPARLQLPDECRDPPAGSGQVLV